MEEVLYETRQHASGVFYADFPPHQPNHAVRTGVLSFLSSRGLTLLKERWRGDRRPKKPGKWISLFVSPKGEHVAVAIRNHITILKKDDEYQEPRGVFTSGSADMFTVGAWSETHDVLGVADDSDTLYFIKANGEEIIRIERKHFKVPLPIIGLLVPDNTDIKGSFLCSFRFLTSDGSVHHVEITQDLGASLSSMHAWSDIKRQLPQDFFCLDYNANHSLLAAVSGASCNSLTASNNSGHCSLSLWRWSRELDLQLLSCVQSEGLYSKPKDYTGLMTSPNVLISPQAKFISTLDLRGCLNVFKLEDSGSSLLPFACGKSGNSILTNYSVRSELFDDTMDFTWWSDNVLVLVRKGGEITMFDIVNDKKLLKNDLSFSLPVVERAGRVQGEVFLLDNKPVEESQTSANRVEVSHLFSSEPFSWEKINQLEISRLSWRLMSFSERSVAEMYDILINNKNYESALNFAENYKLDKDQVFKSQWLHSGKGINDINMFLSSIKDEAFILRETVERVGPSEDAVKGLLAKGLQLTNRYKFIESEDNGCDHIWDCCMSRLRLLQFSDRLETFLGINMGRFSVQEYSKFRIMPLNGAALKLAENGKVGALNLLFKRHPFSLGPFILEILSAIPETVPVQTYGQLLPGRSPPSSSSIRDKDWVECEKMVKYIRNLPNNADRDMLLITEPIIKEAMEFSWPSNDEILAWYKDRARDIDKFSGQLENSLCLLDYGCRKGIDELQKFREDISYLQQLIYSKGSDDGVFLSSSIIEWEHLPDYEKFKTMLKDAQEKNVVERLTAKAILFMQSRSPETASSVDLEYRNADSFLVRWLKEIAMQNNIEMCSLVIEEGCKNVQSGFFTNEVEAVDCALRCIYLCTATDRWNTMASILSKLPHTRGGETTSGRLEKRLKLAEGHIEAGRLLALYQVPKPINFLPEAHKDEKGVKQILRLMLSKFVRRQPGRSDNDWASMWRDLQCLQEKAFPFIDLEYMLMEFCRGLLKAGKFSLARNYLKGTAQVSLPTEKAESLVIQTAREYFFSASSLVSSEIWKAKECLDLLPSSRTVRAEADIMDALTYKLPNLGVNILPVQYKQIKDPMEIIKLAITSQAGAYLNVDELIEVAKLLGLNSQEDISTVQEAIAREAAVAGDLQLAFDLCLVLARKGHGLIWDLCAALARGPAIENINVSSRKQLLGFALCHCDEESIGELLHAWKDLDFQGQSESLMTLSGTRPRSLTIPGFSMISFSDEKISFSKIKDVLSQVAKDLPVENGRSWDDYLKENVKVSSFATLQLPWLVELTERSDYEKKIYPISVPQKLYVSIRMRAVTTILSWLARNGFAPKDDLIASLAKSIMEPPVSEDEDIMGCSFLLNLTDAFHGVEIIEEQLKIRGDYNETCSIMNVGMRYGLLHNSGTECNDPVQRRELLLRKFREKLSADELSVDRTQSTFWRDWKLKLEEQKRTADRTRVVEQLIPGVETVRFLSGDLNYIRSAVFAFIESVKDEKKHVLKDVQNLASTYGLNRTEVLIKFVSCILVSDTWLNDEITTEISEFRGEILAYASETIKTVAFIVYPVIDGCNKTRLAYIYGLLSDCYMHIRESKEPLSIISKNPVVSSARLAEFYKVLEQESYRVSFIKDLNFKNIANICTLNFEHFNREICAHLNGSTVEALAETVRNLVTSYPGVIPEDIISWQDVHQFYVLTLLKNLENRARTNYFVEEPETFLSLLGELEQTYDTCRKHIRVLDRQGAFDIIKQFFTGIIPFHVFSEIVSDNSTWKDCILVILKFWIRLTDDMPEFTGSSENASIDSLMPCLKVFTRFTEEGEVTPSHGWATICRYTNQNILLGRADENFSFCRAMVLSGCQFKTVESVFSEGALPGSVDQSSSSDDWGGENGFRDISDLYLSILESTLSNLAQENEERHNLRNMLSSLSRSGGDLEVLQRVRVAVWERLAKFSGNMQLPNHIRVYVLEVMQSIIGRNGSVSFEKPNKILPWEGWSEVKDRDISTEHDVKNHSDASNRFTHTLVALKSTELAGSISPVIEITADDLLTVDAAFSCFSKLCEVANKQAHFDALLAILREWEGLFTIKNTEEAASIDASDAGPSWADDWDEGWEGYQDEETEKKEKNNERDETLSLHPLSKCWREILKKLISRSQLDCMLKLIDRSLETPNMSLIDETDAHSLTQILISLDSLTALKMALLLPYESVQIHCLDAFEDELKRGGIPELSRNECELLILVLSSGAVSRIFSKPSYGAIFSYLCYLLGHLSRQCQETELSGPNPNNNENGFLFIFKKCIFPCFVAELVKVDQQILAGFLVTKFMHTNPSLSLINVAGAGLKRYLERQLQVLQGDSLCTEEVNVSERLGNAVLRLKVKLKNVISVALAALPNA